MAFIPAFETRQLSRADSLEFLENVRNISLQDLDGEGVLLDWMLESRKGWILRTNRRPKDRKKIASPGVVVHPMH
jgi:hypothetical protein